MKSWLDKSKHIFLLLTLSVIVSLFGCRHPIKETIIPKKLPPEKRVLLAYHPEKFLTTELASAPLLSAENHPHGFKKPDCTRCHTTPSKEAQKFCANCHGNNGTSNQEETCSSCHKTPDEFGFPMSGKHAAHVLRGPRDKDCVQCHPGQRSNSHANGRVDVKFNRGGEYIVPSADKKASCTGIACHEDREWGGEGCDSCHGAPPKTGAHQKHLQPDSTCRNCHQGNQHDDDKYSGIIEIGGIEYNAITGACGVSRCHEGKLSWGCDSCHGYPPKSGNHSKEVHNETCEQCHNNHTHSYKAATHPGDFSGVEVAFARGGEYRDDTDDGIANGLCSNIACHQEQGLKFPIVWGSNCSDCHGNPPDTATHVLHVKEQKNKCQDCHKDAQHDLDKESGNIEVGGVEYNAITGDCVSSCHEKTTPPVAKRSEPLKWKCNVCHGYPPQSGNHISHSPMKPAAYRLSSEVKPRSSGGLTPGQRTMRLFKISDASNTNITCKECHYGHQHSYKSAVSPKEFTDVQVKFAQGGDFDPKSWLCSNIVCHEPFVWGSSCDECHATPPQTGLHALHYKPEVTCDSCHKDRQHDLDRESGAIDVGGVKYDKFTGGCVSTCHKEELWKCTSCHGNPPKSGQHEVHSVELKFGCNTCHNKHEHSYKAITAQVEPQDASVSFTIRGIWEPSTKTCKNVGCHGDRKWEE